MGAPEYHGVFSQPLINEVIEFYKFEVRRKNMGKRLEEMSRRELLKIFGISVGAVIADPAAWPRNVQAQSKKITPRGTARNVIVVQNCGAMSQWETWDFRPTKYTDTFPGKDLDVQKVNADFQISKTLFPQYQKWAPKAALVRTLWENSLVHFTGMYHSQAGRAFNPAILREVPAYGSIVAMELENRSEEHTSELQSRLHLVCRLLLEKKK